MRKLVNMKGLTLIELVVTATILSILLGGIYGILGGTLKLWQHGSEKIDIQQNARIALNMMEMDIRRASMVYNYSSANSMYINVDNQQLRYYLSGTQLLKAATGQGNNPVAYNVSKLQFTYHPRISYCSLVEVYMEFENEGYVYAISSKFNVRAQAFN